MELTGPMTCAMAADLLPWLLNGTLPDGERQEVLLHLEGCQGCRREWEETREASILLGLHPEPEFLTSFIGGVLDAGHAATIEQHLARCAACSRQVGMAREGLERIEGLRRFKDQEIRLERFRWWPAIAAAGGIAAGWFLAVMWLDLAAMETRLRSAELRAQRLTESTQALERVLQAERGPRVNVVAVDLFPVSLVRRSGDGAAGAVQLPAGPGAVALVLNSQAPAREGPFGARLFDALGKLVWKGEGLLRQRHKEFTIQFPPGFLASGEYELHLVHGNSEEAVERYRFRN